MIRCLLTFAAVVLFASNSYAHFPWLSVDKDGNVEFYFGENVSEKSYKLPPGIAKAKVKVAGDKKAELIETKAVEGDEFVGLKSVKPVSTKDHVFAKATFGVYHGAKLQYYTQHLGGEMPTDFASCKPVKGLALQAHAVNTKNGVDVYVLWKGKPLKGTNVRLYCEDGHEEGEGETDADGKVSFTDKEVEDGINGVMVGHTIADETGKVGDEEYKSAMHYLTTTFYDPEG